MIVDFKVWGAPRTSLRELRRLQRLDGITLAEACVDGRLRGHDGMGHELSFRFLPGFKCTFLVDHRLSNGHFGDLPMLLS